VLRCRCDILGVRKKWQLSLSMRHVTLGSAASSWLIASAHFISGLSTPLLSPLRLLHALKCIASNYPIHETLFYILCSQCKLTCRLIPFYVISEPWCSYNNTTFFYNFDLLEHETSYMWRLAATDDCSRRIKIFSANGCRVVPLRLKAIRRDRVRITIRIRWPVQMRNAADCTTLLIVCKGTGQSGAGGPYWGVRQY